jgi:hypothetical protein
MIHVNDASLHVGQAFFLSLQALSLQSIESLCDGLN